MPSWQGSAIIISTLWSIPCKQAPLQCYMYMHTLISNKYLPSHCSIISLYLYPELQLHLYDPIVLLQIWSHGLKTSHSSWSEEQNRLMFLLEILNLCVYLYTEYCLLDAAQNQLDRSIVQCYLCLHIYENRFYCQSMDL